MLVISEEEVESLLDVDRLVDVLARAMADLSGGRASAPSRTAVSVPGERGFLGCMPAYLPAPETLAAKLVSVFPGNRTRPTHQALVCCLDPRSGEPLAVMGGTYLTAARTAAGSVLAARLLARHDAGVVAVIGTGVQARAHARAFRGRGQILVAGRDRRKAEALVDDLAASGVAATATRSIEEAVRVAGIVCLATHADRPVIRRDWLARGTHVGSVGYNTAGEGEVDTETVAGAVVVVEWRQAALAPPPVGAVELRLAAERGALSLVPGPVEVGEIVAGQAQGRRDDSQITLYKSVGVAVQDAAAAALVMEAVTPGQA